MKHQKSNFRVFPECLLNLYSLCLLAVVVLQVLLAIFVFVYNQDIQNTAYKGWDRLWAGRGRSELNNQAIDQIQRTIECCGSQGFLDYGLQIPASCCPSDSQTCNQLFAYKTGCKTQLKSFIQNSASWIAYLSIAMAIVEVRN
jgi:Tetraspanin family